MTYELLKLPYDYDALEPYIDAKTMEIHHNKHHAGYVDKLNQVLENYPKLKNIPIHELLKDLSKIPKEIRTAVINTGGGHANHTLFWEIMKPVSEYHGDNDEKEHNELLEQINKTYGSLESFKEQFSKAALTQFGSGWAWLTVNKNKLRIEQTSNQDTPLSKGRIPILGIDVWEHAYYLKYQNKRADFIQAWWNVVNWKQVNKKYKEIKN